MDLKTAQGTIRKQGRLAAQTWVLATKAEDLTRDPDPLVVWGAARLDESLDPAVTEALAVIHESVTSFVPNPGDGKYSPPPDARALFAVGVGKVSVLRVEHGALAQCPEWESGKRGKNWAAIVTQDPRAPGGLGRVFWDRAHGAWYYIVPDLEPGAVVEFAAKDFTSRGAVRCDSRTYGNVLRQEANSLVLVCWGSSEKDAFARQGEIRALVEAQAPAAEATAPDQDPGDGPLTAVDVSTILAVLRDGAALGHEARAAYQRAIELVGRIQA